jgi:hypothetical protein
MQLPKSNSRKILVFARTSHRFQQHCYSDWTGWYIVAAGQLHDLGATIAVKVAVLTCPDAAGALFLIRFWCLLSGAQRRGSSRHLTLQPQAAVIKTTLDFASGVAEAKKQEARRAADHGPRTAIMAPF